MPADPPHTAAQLAAASETLAVRSTQQRGAVRRDVKGAAVDRADAQLPGYRELIDQIVKHGLPPI